MEADANRVIVTPGGAFGTAGPAQVHHRDFPEIRAEGESPAVAAANLANKLTQALDTALTDWRRQTIQQAIADVNVFATAGRAG